MTFILRVGEPITEHDYTRSSWGHALHEPKIKQGETPVTFWQRLRGIKPTPYTYLTAMGHGQGIETGHTILLKMQSGKVARFRVVEIEWKYDPRDMFDLKRADFVDYVD